MKIKMILFFLLLSFLLISIEINIESPVIENNSFSNKLPTLLTSGQPKIPYIPVKILLPMGEKVNSVEVVYQRCRNSLENIYIEPCRQIQPISGAFKIPEVPKDWTVYGNDEFFPNDDYKVLGTQRLNGFEVLLLNLYPYKYKPATSEVSWNEKAEISIQTEFDELLFEEQNRFLLKNEQTENIISKLVKNPENLATYRKHSVFLERDLPDPSDPYTMIIITDESIAPYLLEFVDWKNEIGVKTKVFYTSEIYDSMTGRDDAEKIKNFVQYAYLAYAGTEFPLEHVILGGDDEIIPIRGVYINTGHGTVDHNLPCDLYYSCLDNDWDGNGNDVFGEIEDNVDLLPEISIARIPAETEAEFSNFFDKTYSYVENASVGNDVVYLVGENLNWDPLTWGGDYKDEVAESVPTMTNDYHIFTLYDREGTYSGNAVKNAIDSGLHIINHMGHSNESIVFGQNAGSVSSYINTEYGFAYSQGCYPAAFDEATSQQSESIGENLVIRQKGLFAFVGNTRYGWYSPGNTNGPSQPYDITFFEAIFNDNIRELGKALADSRIVMVNQAMENVYLRWVHYELVLFGDPSVMVKEANGNFPFIQPGEVVYDDVQGDGDGIINPGETIEIFVSLENLPGWADATDVSATVEFVDETINVIQNNVFYGNIASGNTLGSSPFIIQIPQDCDYDSYDFSLEVNSEYAGNTIFQRTYYLNFAVSLFQKNWPWNCSYGITSNPVITDFDGNGSKEIMVINAFADISLLSYNAVQLPGYPLETDESIWRSTALADIDGDDSNDIIIAGRSGNILVLNNNGEIIFEYENCCEQLLTPIVADINGDDSPEIISFGTDMNLLVLDSSGDLLPGFPVELNMLAIAEMACADLDQNGTSEILIGTLDGLLSAIDEDGQNIDGFPVQLSAGITAAPIVLDNLKIALGTSDNKFYLLNNAGDILVTRDLESKIANSPIAADFNNDGELEIAFSTQTGDIYLIRQDGSDLTGFPISIDQHVTNPPLAVDLNNDNNLNLLLFTGLNNFYAYHADGSEVAFAPVPVNLSGNTPATIGDIDYDGDFDIIAGASNSVLIIDSKLPKGEKIPWHTYRGNYQRTGFYGDNILITEAEDSVTEIQKTQLFQNYPNPFNSSTTISFNLATENTENTEIEIFNIKGQKVKSISVIPSGVEGSINWNGKDEKGKPVSSGIYLYKLNIDNKTKAVRKCLLIK